MKTWLISDTHGSHQLLTPPEVDLVIFAGDESNSHSPYINEGECWNFLAWFSKLSIPHKIMIAGNHSSAIEKRLITPKQINDLGIHYLEHEFLELGGFEFFGSPYTPSFNDWYFMKKRETIGRIWEGLESVDVLVTHGPPKGILDITTNKENVTEHVGDGALYKTVQRIKPRFHVFGHIHNGRSKDSTDINSGIFSPGESATTYINASVVRDGQLDHVINNGYLINL